MISMNLHVVTLKFTVVKVKNKCDYQTAPDCELIP